MLKIKLLWLTLILCSCMKSYQQNDQAYYHDSGQKKPRVSFVSVFDHSDANIEWNLSEELSDMIEQKFLQQKKIYLIQDFEPLIKNQDAHKNMNIFLDSSEWIKESQSNSEFVVFVELLKHSLTQSTSDHHLISTSSKKAYNLDISLRIKVIDLRKNVGKVILQQILHQSFFIPYEYSRVVYKPDPWTRAMFSLSPIGMAHIQIVKKITAQIEDYILLAKTK